MLEMVDQDTVKGGSLNSARGVGIGMAIQLFFGAFYFLSETFSTF